ncbi:MAG TPA: hypothetical protein DD490_14175 [Acidobacteria bacterium]|nr:hypothetical protein [Acidobacteriota bacterium]
MHRIEETKYGYKLILEGFLQREEVNQLLTSMKTKIRPREKGETFPLLLDMRKSNAFPSDAREILKQCLLFCKESGMQRNAVILASAIATLQARRIAKETGIDRWARYIDASSRPNDWEKAAVDWLTRGVEPEITH